jgi:hypothetical protein
VILASIFISDDFSEHWTIGNGHKLHELMEECLEYGFFPGYQGHIILEDKLPDKYSYLVRG